MTRIDGRTLVYHFNFPLFTLCATKRPTTLVLISFAGAKALPVYHHQELAEFYIDSHFARGVEYCEIPGPNEFCVLVKTLFERGIGQIVWNVARAPSPQQAQSVPEVWNDLARAGDILDWPEPGHAD